MNLSLWAGRSRFSFCPRRQSGRSSLGRGFPAKGNLQRSQVASWGRCHHLPWHRDRLAQPQVEAKEESSLSSGRSLWAFSRGEVDMLIQRIKWFRSQSLGSNTGSAKILLGPWGWSLPFYSPSVPHTPSLSHSPHPPKRDYIGYVQSLPAARQWSCPESGSSFLLGHGSLWWGRQTCGFESHLTHTAQPRDPQRVI